MYLLQIRHAIAEDRVEFARSGQSDHYRPLTPRGCHRMTLGAAGLHTIVPEIDILASSPLTRAEQTAEIIAAEYDMPGFERVEALGTGDGESLLEWLESLDGLDSDRTVAIVGHEPFLSEWASWLLAGRTGGFLLVKKGSAVLLEFPVEVRPGAAWLHWALTPRQLRRLARTDGGEE